MDCSLPGSSVHGIFQARVLEWGAIAFSGARGQLNPSWRGGSPPPQPRALEGLRQRAAPRGERGRGVGKPGKRRPSSAAAWRCILKPRPPGSGHRSKAREAAAFPDAETWTSRRCCPHPAALRARSSFRLAAGAQSSSPAGVWVSFAARDLHRRFSQLTLEC